MSFTGYAPGWQLRCRKCGLVRDAAGAGIVRIGGWGRKYILRSCPQCHVMSFQVLEKSDLTGPDPTNKYVRRIITFAVLFALLFPPLLFFGIRYGLSRAAVYQTAVQRILNDPDISAELGPPLKCKMWNGRISNGHADIRFTVIGERSRGKCHVIADKVNNKWIFKSINLHQIISKNEQTQKKLN